MTTQNELEILLQAVNSRLTANQQIRLSVWSDGHKRYQLDTADGTHLSRVLNAAETYEVLYTLHALCLDK